MMKIANAPDMMNPIAGKYIVMIGFIIVIIGIIQMLMKKQRTKDVKRLLSYIGVWALTIVGVVLVFKGPNILINQISTGTFSPVKFIKSTLLVDAKISNVLLATTDAEAVAAQSSIDNEALATANLAPEQCAEISFTDEQLS